MIQKKLKVERLMKLLEISKRIQILKQKINYRIEMIRGLFKPIQTFLISIYVFFKIKAVTTYELILKEILIIKCKVINFSLSLKAYLEDLIKTPWSAKSVADAKEVSWKSSNLYRKRHSISVLERYLLIASEHPLRFAVLIILLHFTVLYSIGFTLPDWVISNDNWEISDQLTHFSTIWAIQTTLVALVYPIVISFVAVYLQRRPSAEAMINLYMLDSGALVAGISSLLLVIVMGCHYFLIGLYAPYWMPVWAAADIVWFLLNAILTTYFLFRTVEFLRPEIQAKVVKKYSINVALTREIHQLNTFLALDGDGVKSWFLAPSFIDASINKGPCLLISGYDLLESQVQLEKSFKSQSRIVDIRMPLIKLVVDYWYWQASNPNKENTAVNDNRISSRPRLSLNIAGSIYEGKKPIATVSNGPPLRTWQKIFLRWAIVFKSASSKRYSIKVEDILKELGADAINTLSNYDKEGFVRAWELLVQMHELLLAASLNRTESDKYSSYAMLHSAVDVFGRPLHFYWNEKYRDIFQAGIDGMVQDNYPLKRMCNLLARLQSEETLKSPIHIKYELLRIPPLMMYQLSNWWAFRVEEQGIIDHSHKQMVVLRLPLNRVYEEALSAFVSGWESSRPHMPRIDQNLPLIWSELSDAVQLQVHHINETARMLLAAVFRGDQAAAEWLADVLNKWWGTLDYEHEPHQLYWVSSKITVEDLALSWETFCIKYEIKSEDPNLLRKLQTGVYRTAVKNYWIDIVLISVEIMIGWVRTIPAATSNTSLAFEISTGLLLSKQWKAGGQKLDVFSSMSAKEYFAAKVRQNVAPAGKGGGGYSWLLDNFVERNREMQMPNMISSRIYSGRGSDDIGLLLESELFLLIVLSNERLNLNESIIGYFEIWINDRLDLAKNVLILEDYLDSLLRLFETTTASINHIQIFKDKIRPTEHRAEFLIELTNTALNEIKSTLKNRRLDVMATLPIDHSRLIEIARFASKSGFKKESGLFPIHLFNIEYTSQVLNPYTFIFDAVSRQEVTKLQLQQRSYSESQFDIEISSYVAGVVLDETIRTIDIKGITIQDAETYWSELKEHANRIIEAGDTPILLLQYRNYPEWIRDWLYPDFNPRHSRPVDMNVTKKENMGQGYICDFNGVEIYSAPLLEAHSIVIAKEVFKDLTFTYFGGERERTVDAHVVKLADSKSAVDLQLTFAMNVETVKKLASRLIIDL